MGPLLRLAVFNAFSRGVVETLHLFNGVMKSVTFDAFAAAKMRPSNAHWYLRLTFLRMWKTEWEWAAWGRKAFSSFWGLSLDHSKQHSLSLHLVCGEQLPTSEGTISTCLDSRFPRFPPRLGKHYHSHQVQSRKESHRRIWPWCDIHQEQSPSSNCDMRWHTLTGTKTPSWIPHREHQSWSSCLGLLLRPNREKTVLCQMMHVKQERRFFVCQKHFSRTESLTFKPKLRRNQSLNCWTVMVSFCARTLVILHRSHAFLIVGESDLHVWAWKFLWHRRCHHSSPWWTSWMNTLWPDRPIDSDASRFAPLWMVSSPRRSSQRQTTSHSFLSRRWAAAGPFERTVRWNSRLGAFEEQWQFDKLITIKLRTCFSLHMDFFLNKPNYTGILDPGMLKNTINQLKIV